MLIEKNEGDNLMARVNAERDESTGQFKPSRTAAEIVAGIGELDKVIKLKRELKDMRNIYVKNLRGTLTSPKLDEDGLQVRDDKGRAIQEPYSLDSKKESNLLKYIEMLMDKLAPNAKVVGNDNGPQKIVIRKPKRG